MKTDILFIASMKPGAGKLLVTLGIIEMLKRSIDRVGFFRPVVDLAEGERDVDAELILSRYCPFLSYEEVVGFSADEVKSLAGQGRMKEILTAIIARVEALREKCNFVVVEGLNSSGFMAAFDKDINITMARNLGAPFVSVIHGQELRPEDLDEAVTITHEAVTGEGCPHLAIFVNRVPPREMERAEEVLRDQRRSQDFPPIFIIPESEELDRPTVSDIMRHTGARLVLGRQEDLDRVVRQCKIASMTMEHFLEHVEAGDLIITAGDRSDIVVASLVSLFSPHYAKIAAILLTGGFVPGPNVMRLIEGRTIPAPVISLPDDTYSSTRAVDMVPAAITARDERKIALALGLFDRHVDQQLLIAQAEITRAKVMTPAMFEFRLFEQARRDRRHIVLPESEDERILRAAEILLRRDAAAITLLGPEERIRANSSALGLDLDKADFVDPSRSPWTQDFAMQLHEMRRHKGMTLDAARDAMTDPNYFGTMMVHTGLADGMVSGAVHTTADTIRPALQIIKTAPGYRTVSSCFFMCFSTKVLIYADCAIIPDPDAEQLAEIAIASAETAKAFGIEPLVAMLSYSSGSSGKGEDVEKVRKATELVRKLRPELPVDGPIQYDAAIDPEVARKKMPNSPVAGKATVFIFPDLNTGNNTYKAVQRASGAVAIGPILQGLKKPVNDLSRGCTVPDVINTVAITAIQAQQAALQDGADREDGP